MKSYSTNLCTFGSNIAAQLGIGYEIGESREMVEVKIPGNLDEKAENEQDKDPNKKKNDSLGDINVVKVACGSLHTLVLTSENRLYSWGCNDEKALGRTGDEEFPGEVVFCLQNTETKTKTRKNENRKTDIQEKNIFLTDKIIDMGCGQSSSFVLTESGLLFGWGLFRDASGPIGFFTRKQTSLNRVGPLKTVKTPINYPVLLSKGVKSLSVGGNHIIYKTKQGVYALGVNTFGEKGTANLKRKSKLEQIVPVLLANKRNKMFKEGEFFCGQSNTFFVAEECIAFGNNSTGQFGIQNTISGAQKRKISVHKIEEIDNDKNMKRKIEDDQRTKRVKKTNDDIPEKIVKIACGETHSIFLTNKNNVYGCGNNDFGQLNSKEIGNFSEMKFITDNCTEIRANGFFSYVKKNDTWYSWGFNNCNELGHDGNVFEKTNMFNGSDDVQLGHDFVVVRKINNAK